MSPVAVLAVQCLLIIAASLAGGWIPMLVRLTHRRLEMLVSFVSGVMLGVALLHLLPHAWMEHAAWRAAHGGGAAAGHGSLTPVVAWMLGGFLAMFFIERFFRFHHHDATSPRDGPDGDAHGHQHPHQLTWAGAAVGLTLHSLTAGVALGAAVMAEMPAAGAVTWTAGLGAFLAIALHKPFDAMTLGTLLAAGHGSPRLRHIVNAAFGLVVPVGVVLFFMGAQAVGEASPRVLAAALSFSAGTFLCISLSDLLPELQFHRHDRIALSASLLLGVAVAWGASTLETRLHEPHASGPGSIFSTLDGPRPMDILIRPCTHEPAPSRSSLPGPAEGRPRSVHRNLISTIGLALGGADVIGRGWRFGVRGSV